VDVSVTVVKPVVVTVLNAVADCDDETVVDGVEVSVCDIVLDIELVPVVVALEVPENVEVAVTLTEELAVALIEVEPVDTCDVIAVVLPVVDAVETTVVETELVCDLEIVEVTVDEGLVNSHSSNIPSEKAVTALLKYDATLSHVASSATQYPNALQLTEAAVPKLTLSSMELIVAVVSAHTRLGEFSI
jgi:hypothetical protein